MPQSKEVNNRRRKYPRYTDMPKGADISYGDPDTIFGTEYLFHNYQVTKQVFWVDPESVVGKLHAGDDVMELTAEVKYRALQLIQYDDNGLATGKVIYTIYRKMFPQSLMSWQHVDVEQIVPDWPQGVEFPQGSIVTEITKLDARTLAINVEDIWKERGGNPKYKFPKSGGRYDGDFAELAQVIRGEKAFAFSPAHDLAVHETLLLASGMPLT